MGMKGAKGESHNGLPGPPGPPGILLFTLDVTVLLAKSRHWGQAEYHIWVCCFVAQTLHFAAHKTNI